jgi:hypothetical protein
LDFTATGNSATATTTVTSAAGEIVLDVVAHRNSTYTIIPDGSQTQQWTQLAQDPGNAVNGARGAGSTKAGAASTQMTWSISGTAQWAIGAVPIKPASVTVTNVTYAGTNITSNLIGTATNAGNCAVSLYYMLNPPNASNNVSVTLSGNTWFVIAASSYFGVHQTTTFGTFNSASGNSAAASVNVSSASGELVVDAMALQDDSLGGTADSPQVERWGDWTVVGANGINNYGSTKAGAASTTMSWTLSGSSYWAFGAVTLKTASPAVSITEVMYV